MPDETPVTTPEVPMVAIPVLPLLHEPPGDASVRPIVLPIHTADGPVIEPADGVVMTVTIAVAAEAPHELDIV